MKTPIKLENWAVVALDPYTAPELGGRLEGRAARHPHKQGVDVHVVTSRVVAVDKRFVTTQSGSVYELGTPKKEYVEYLNKIGYTLDPETPIKIIKRDDAVPGLQRVTELLKS